MADKSTNILTAVKKAKDPIALNKALEALPFLPPFDVERKIAKIKKENWNKVFTYSFKLMKTDPSGRVQVNLKPDLSNFNGIDTVELKLPPSRISISKPYAVDITPTSDGILEETSGVVFRTITISGTTGLFPGRQSDASSSPSSGLLAIAQSTIPGTTAAITNLFNQAKQVKNAVTGNAGSNQQFPEFGTGVDGHLTQTGYYQFWYLNNFLDAYIENRRTPQHRRTRLVFQMPKHNVAFVCTPLSLDADFDSSDPYLIKYRLVLRVWDLAPLAGEIKPVQNENLPSPKNQGAIKSVLNVLNDTYNLIFQKKNILLAVNSDINNVLNVYNLARLSVKEAAGIGKDLSDFSDSLKANAKIAVQGNLSDKLIQVWNNEAENGNPNATSVLNQTFKGNPSGLGTITASADAAQKQLTPSGETVTAQSSSGQASFAGQGLITALNAALDDPSVASQISLSDFSIPAPLQQAIDNQTKLAQQTTANDIRTLVDNLNTMSDQIAYATGAIDTNYTDAYGLLPPTTAVRELTEDDVILQAGLEDAKTSYLSLLATGELYQEREPDPFATANQFLDATDQMQSPLSAYPVTMEYESSLERMAQKYLGDATRGREIALLNNLKSPYIDETGFTVTLSGLTGQTGLVTDVSNLEINQQVIIYGTGVAQSIRRIMNIEDLGGDTYRITFDGLNNLDVFTASTSPYLWARTPGTVGGGDTILIPSDIDPGAPATRPSSREAALSYAERVFLTDILLSPSGDLVFDNMGDFVRATGYTNALQALNSKMVTTQKELEYHMDYGLPVKIGMRSSDVTSDFKQTVQALVTNDPRFQSATVDIIQGPNYERIIVTGQGPQGTAAIPVSFQVGKIA